MDYKKLQNGSDIRGIALSNGGQVPNLTPAETRLLTRGFMLWLMERTMKNPGNLTIAIGRDPRLSGSRLMQAAETALSECGIRVLSCGLASTPAMFMSTRFTEFDCDGAIMITASHLPADRNGFKYFSKEGGLGKSDIARIIAFAEEGAAPAEMPKQPRPIETADLMAVYCSFLQDQIVQGVAHPENRKNPLTGMKIAVDAGNGSGGFYARQVLAPLGADISGSKYLDPDGTFPNHPPNPEDAQAMHALSMAVLESGSDLGLIFDTDVDRSAAVDSRGREISRNGIVAMAAALAAEDHPGTCVVTDSITSDQLNVFLTEKLGLQHHRYKRGYKNVIDEAVRLNAEGTDSQLAIETSGHAAFKENHFLDDGAYLATKIVIKAAKLALLGKGIDTVIEDLEEPLEAKEFRLKIESADFSARADQVLSSLEQYAAHAPGMTIVTPNYEGIRVSFDEEHGDGWCLLRKSLHDPILPLNVESNQPGGCRHILDQLAPILNAFSLPSSTT